jgi:predicted HTH transcriptional regulator
LLGVDDDGSVSGTTRDKLDEWVAELCRTKISPPLIPYLSWAKDVELGKSVMAVRVPTGPNKPYARVHHNHSTYFVRVGSTCREASREELERMFQASGRVQYGLKPVPGATLDDLENVPCFLPDPTVMRRVPIRHHVGHEQENRGDATYAFDDSPDHGRLRSSELY